MARRTVRLDSNIIPKSVYQAKQPISFSIFCLYALAWLQTALGWGPVAVHFRRRDGIPNARVHFHPVQNSDAHLPPARLAATFISWTLLLHRKLRGMVAPPENAIKPQLHSKKEPLQLPLPGEVIAGSKVSTPAIELKVK